MTATACDEPTARYRVERCADRLAPFPFALCERRDPSSPWLYIDNFATIEEAEEAIDRYRPTETRFYK